MKVYKNATTENYGTNDNPDYNNNISGYHEIGRLANGIDVKVETLSVAQVLQFTYKFDYQFGVVQKITKPHKLGYRPIVFGTYKFKTKGNTRLLGDLPMVYETDGITTFAQGVLWVDDITNGDITIAWYIPETGSEELQMKLYLMSNECI